VILVTRIEEHVRCYIEVARICLATEAHVCKGLAPYQFSAPLVSKFCSIVTDGLVHLHTITGLSIMQARSREKEPRTMTAFADFVSDYTTYVSKMRHDKNSHSFSGALDSSVTVFDLAIFMFFDCSLTVLCFLQKLILEVHRCDIHQI
jgi:hypothetical protein